MFTGPFFSLFFSLLFNSENQIRLSIEEQVHHPKPTRGTRSEKQLNTTVLHFAQSSALRVSNFLRQSFFSALPAKSCTNCCKLERQALHHHTTSPSRQALPSDSRQPAPLLGVLLTTCFLFLFFASCFLRYDDGDDGLNSRVLPNSLAYLHVRALYIRETRRRERFRKPHSPPPPQHRGTFGTFGSSIVGKQSSIQPNGSAKCLACWYSIVVIFKSSSLNVALLNYSCLLHGCIQHVVEQVKQPTASSAISKLFSVTMSQGTQTDNAYQK